VAIKEGNFAIFDGEVVAVEKMETPEVATIRQIRRDFDDCFFTVPVSELSPFDAEIGKELIGEYNMRIHAIKECMRYL